MSYPNPHVAEVSNATARELVLAKAQAEHGGYDGCFERIAEWWAQEQWERDAQPQEFPYSDYEDAAAWVIRARAGLVALDAFDDPEIEGAEGDFDPDDLPAEIAFRRDELIATGHLYEMVLANMLGRVLEVLPASTTGSTKP